MHLEEKGGRASVQKLAMEIHEYQAKSIPANVSAAVYQEWLTDTFADSAKNFWLS